MEEEDTNKVNNDIVIPPPAINQTGTLEYRGRSLRELDSHPGKGLKFVKNAEGAHYSLIVVDLD